MTPIRFHDLPHTLGSLLAMKGVPVLKIKALMGHRDIQTTMRYMHLAPAELQGVTELLLGKDSLGSGISGSVPRAAVP